MGRKSHYVKQKSKEFGLNIGKSLWPIIRELTTPLTFLDQISRKDRETLGSAWDNAGWTQKGKIMVNIILGRVTGFNVFKEEYQTQQTINPAGIVNKWTGTGFGFWLYSKIPIRQLPLKAKLGAIGKRMMTGGGIGGLFDAKGGINEQTNQGTRHILAPDANRQRGIIMQNRSRSNQGSDTVEGGFDY